MPSPIPQDRLVRKETSLGVIREYEPPQTHIGLRMFAPLRDVGSDDVIFDYTRGLTEGLAPARAEDAESELAGKDESIGSGRASIIDWAHKHHYDPSDVTRYREGLMIGELVGGAALPLTNAGNADFMRRVARDDVRRRRMLDNRLEWLIFQMIDKGKIEYNDGKVIFTVQGNRPADQQDVALPSGAFFGETGSQPIEDILAIKEESHPEIRYDRALISEKAFRRLYKSPGFVDALTGANPLYKVAGWGIQAAADFVQAQADLTFIIVDHTYATRALGPNGGPQYKRFMREDVMIMLPSQETVNNIDDAIGFGATLTSPHPEGNWTSGYYEWEKDTGPDPWGHDRGTGIKAFPVMPHLDMTTVVKVLATPV